MDKKKKLNLFLGLLSVSFIYTAVFGLIFQQKLLGSADSFLFQVVVALMSTGVLALVTGFMFVFQSEIESRGQNKSKVFQNKIDFYKEAIATISEAARKPPDYDSVDELFNLATRSMLIASPNAAEKLTDLYQTFKDGELIANAFKEFVQAARQDLDLIDELSDGSSDSLVNVLKTIEESFGEDLKIRSEAQLEGRSGKRSWSNEEKERIIQEYYERESGRRNWLEEAHGLTPTYIYMWKKQLGMSDQSN